jgi:4-hydroxy-tetrahydrodipicolinate synthase
MNTKQTLVGILAPVLTPVHPDLSPDAERWIALCKHLLQAGCHGLCPFGTTSEANSFAVEERIDLLEQLIESHVPAAQLMPGTGCCALPDTVRLTTHAVRIGCAGVLVLPPFYYKGVSDDGLFRSFSEVIERVGDRRLRMYLYHIPPIAQVGISLRLIERLIHEYPDTVVGIKDSSGDWNNLEAILTTFPGFGTFTGNEKFLLATLRGSGAGSINAVANVAPQPQRKLYEQWSAPAAPQIQTEIDQLRQIMQPYPTIAGLKTIMAYLRDDPAWLYLRPPLSNLNSSQSEALLKSVATLPYLRLPVTA